MKRPTTLHTTYRLGDGAAAIDCGACDLTEYMEAVAHTIATLIHSAERIADAAGVDGHAVGQRVIDMAGHALHHTDWSRIDGVIKASTKEAK